MFAFIYKITNKVNGKVYIGQTLRTIEQRWKEHISGNSKCQAISRAIKKYGEDKFDVERVFVAKSLEVLNKKEVEFINKFNSLTPNGYNIKTGGYQSRIPNLSEKHKKNIGKANTGKKHSEETKHKISRAKKGSNAWNLGIKLSVEHKNNLSKANLGKKHSEETKAKISNSMKILRARDNG